MPEPLSDTAAAAEEAGGREPREYLAMLRRRKGEILAVAAVVAAIAVAVALILPPVYRANATILVQEQEIPPELVRSTITSYADERIQVISQQVMTRAVLMQLVDKYGLYGKYRARLTDEELVARMRKDIRLSTIDSNISDRSSGRRVNATIAFEISYEAPQPEAAQHVVDDLVQLYLNENVKARQQSVAETAAFLGQEAERVGNQLREIEANLAAFKRRHAGSLPDSAPVNLQLAERTSSELQRIEREMGLLQDRRLSLEAQLLLVRPNVVPTLDPSPDRPQTPQERLRALRAQYTASAAIYGADHPDLRRMQREIAALETQTGNTGEEPGVAEPLRELESRLATLRKTYADTHPDVQRLLRSIAALKAAAPKGAAARGSGGGRMFDAPQRPDNPAYILLAAQIESTKREMAQLVAQRDDLRARQRTYDARLAQVPDVEREYQNITRDYENTQARYREITAKQMQAGVAMELEKDRKAERFSLSEPSHLPQRPIGPKRLLIVAIGLAAALAGGVAFAWAHEAIDPSIKGPPDLARVALVPILTAIPYIETQREHVLAARRNVAAAALLGLATCALVLAIHVYLQPLPQVFAGVARRLTLW
jgi:uncharacterized protein involved in exopolysaccharide biosynthesis